MKYLLILLGGLFVLGCDKSQETPEPKTFSPSVATVDGKKIGQGMLQAHVDYKMKLIDIARKINLPMRKREKREVWEKRRENFMKVANREVLLREVIAAAAKRAGVTASEAHRNRIRSQYELMLGRKVGCSDAILPILEKHGIREEFEQKIEAEAVELTYLNSLSPEVNLDVTESDVDEAIQRIEKRNAGVREYNAGVYQTASNVLARVKAGEDFGLLAREFSYAEDKDEGGDMGQIILSGESSYCTYAPAYTKALIMEDGAISDVVRTPAGLEIFQVVSNTELEDPNDPVMKKMRHICFRLQVEQTDYKRKDIKNALTQGRVQELYSKDAIRRILDTVQVSIPGVADPKTYFVPEETDGGQND